jgi:NitT/TauT family transport system substrate-binding protein
VISRTSRRWLIIIVLIPILAMTLPPGCQKKEAGLTHLKVVALPYLSFATFYIAQDEGYFTEQGLDVEFVKFNSVAEAMPLLAQGQLDVAAGPMSASLINAIVQNVNIKIVAGREYTGFEGYDASLLARKDLYDSGEFDTIAKVKDRKVAITAIGSLQHFDLSKILESAGLTLADIGIIKLSPQECITGFGNGAIEAALLGNPQNVQVTTLGYAVTLQSINKLLPGFQQGFIIFGPSLLEKNPVAGRKFLVAYLKGVRQLAQGLTEENMAILLKYTGLDRETVVQSNLNPIYPDGRIMVEDILTFQDWLYDNKFVDQKLSSEQLIDTRFIEGANQVLGQPK